MQTTLKAAAWAGLMFAAQAGATTNTFSLQADPSSIEVAPGHGNTVTISSSVVSGSAESISFSAHGMPANVTATFNPASVETGSSTTLTIAANSAATLGDTATITVSGTSISDAETTTVAVRLASYLSQQEWAAFAALYNSTGGTEWTTNTGWDFSGSGPSGTECGWFGIQCDTIPRVIGIELQNNHLTGVLPDLSAFSGLTTFDVYGNSLTGSLPTSIQSLSALTHVDVSSNQLSGGLDMLNGLSNLQFFGGDGNAFTNTLPQLDSLPNLMGFSVQGNLLTGPMPSLALSPKLVYLNVSANYLSGAFPSLTGLAKLQYLYISENRFTGAMPIPPNPTRFGSGVVSLCTNFFAPIDNRQWDALLRLTPWYATCDTDTIFAVGFGTPPFLQ